MELQPPTTSEPRTTTNWQSYFDLAELFQTDNIPGLNVRYGVSFTTS